MSVSFWICCHYKPKPSQHLRTDMPNNTIELNFYLKPSRLANIWMTSCHSLAFISIAFSYLPQALKIGFLLMVSMSGFLSHWRNRRDQQLGTQIRLTARKGWQIKNGQEHLLSVEILPSTWMCAWLVLLHYRSNQQFYVRPIFCDALDKEAFRRLRVYLRISAVGVR